MSLEDPKIFVSMLCWAVYSFELFAARRIDVRSAAQMHATVLGALPADVYIGAAAVADFAPRAIATGKIKKQPGHDTLMLELVRTPDILADVAPTLLFLLGLPQPKEMTGTICSCLFSRRDSYPRQDRSAMFGRNLVASDFQLSI